jgi:hypothetical protein
LDGHRIEKSASYRAASGKDPLSNPPTPGIFSDKSSKRTHCKLTHEEEILAYVDIVVGLVIGVILVEEKGVS